ncbi:MAG: ORF6N domain-containing protein [Arcobacteraceae bacterium]|nr:ORF6N domain-containing protein [Arcobacteraceae bacterium]
MNLSNNHNIETTIYEIRKIKVMLDSDLAKLYQVETKRINEAVRNNPEKFPSDFIFELTKEEEESLRSKFSTFNESLKSRKYRSKVFTEQGVYMLATVLKSKIATEVTINIMRTFTKMREFALNYNDITKRLQEIEKTIKIDQQQVNYNSHRIDEAFELLNEILRDTQKTSNNLIGFRPKEDK